MATVLHQDIDPQETREWLDALEALIEAEGPERAHYLLEALIDKARRRGVDAGPTVRTPAYQQSAATPSRPTSRSAPPGTMTWSGGSAR